MINNKVLFDMKDFTIYANKLKTSVINSNNTEFSDLTKKIIYLFSGQLMDKYFELNENEEGFDIYFVGEKSERESFDKKIMYKLRFSNDILEPYVNLFFTIKDEEKSVKIFYCEIKTLNDMFKLDSNDESTVRKLLMKYFEEIDYFCYTINRLAESNVFE